MSGCMYCGINCDAPNATHAKLCPWGDGNYVIVAEGGREDAYPPRRDYGAVFELGDGTWVATDSPERYAETLQERNENPKHISFISRFVRDKMVRRW
jgi:hypothetical protein